MAILRKNKKSDYTIIDNNIFRNKTLSLKAKGMICTMLSLPDGWEFSEEGLTKLSNDGISSIRSTLKELMEFGYLVRERNRDEKGILRDTTYTIFEEPTLENPILDYPILENEHNKILYNKELNNIKENNNINIITKEKFKKPTLEEVKDYCRERNNEIDAETFIDFYESKGWKVGKTPMKDWKAAIRNWERSNRKVIKKENIPQWFDKEQDIKLLSKEEQDEMESILNDIWS